MVDDIRGKGLMVGIELVKDRKTKQPAPKERDRLVQMAFEKGLWVLGCRASTFCPMPPLAINQRQAEFAVRVLDRCLSHIEGQSRGR